MGIDVYARWRNQTKEEKKGQITGFSVESGNIGYLREAYHGGPYVTMFLMPEAYDPEAHGLVNMYRNNRNGEIMPYDQLPEDVKNAPWSEDAYDSLGVQIPAAKMRERLPTAVMMGMYREFKIYGNGEKQPWMINIEEIGDGGKNFMETLMANMSDKSHEEFAAAMKPEMVAFAQKMIDDKTLPDVVQSFVDFVDLCETIEKRDGEPCFVYMSA